MTTLKVMRLPLRFLNLFKRLASTSTSWQIASPRDRFCVRQFLRGDWIFAKIVVKVRQKIRFGTFSGRGGKFRATRPTRCQNSSVLRRLANPKTYKKQKKRKWIFFGVVWAGSWGLAVFANGQIEPELAGWLGNGESEVDFFFVFTSFRVSWLFSFPPPYRRRYRRRRRQRKGPGGAGAFPVR